tara:strand:+ start:543 stop:947 length:405 start_codon:yes stop_codon:yes gene_type:complete
MPQPKVNIANSSGDLVGVTSNALDVNIAGGATIDIGDVEVKGHSGAGHFALNVRTVGGGGSGPTQLTDQACKHADIMANLSNTGIIYIGASGVGATTGIALYPGDVYSVDVENTNLLYALPTNDNEDINVVYYT